MSGRVWIYFLLVILIFIPVGVIGQYTDSAVGVVHSTENENNRGRLGWVIAGHTLAYGGSITGLSIMWYSKQPQSHFHFFNDDDEWLQVDKAGHLYSAYQMSRASYALWQWAGVSHNKSVWLGGLSGLAFQSIVEVLDGFQSEYGFSPGDYIANVTGTAAFISQQLTWNDQRIKIKFSSNIQKYNEPDLVERARNIYGSSIPERILKDYNHQTYWVSANVQSFFKINNLPKWFNLAIGYGAAGMFGARSNIAKNENGMVIFDRSDIRRYRQWYLSPDIDFTRIKTNKRGVRVLLFVLDAFKMPAPALEFSKGKIKGHWLFF